MRNINSDLSDSLDGIRGVGSLLIFLAHFNQIFNLPASGLESFSAIFFQVVGSYAVTSFFVLSGFLITLSITKNIERNRDFLVAPYLKDRFVRIFPPFVFSILLCIVIYAIIVLLGLYGSESYRLPGDVYIARERVDINAEEYWKTLTMWTAFDVNISSISLNGPLWSIAYEWWIYIFAIFATLWTCKKSWVFGAIPIGVVGSYLLYTDNVNFIFFILVWGVGALAALFFLKKRELDKKNRAQLIFFLCMCVVVQVIQEDKVYIPYNGIYEMIFQYIVVLLLLLLFTGNRFQRLFANKIFLWFASYSYTLYVIHFPLLLLLFSISRQFYVQSVVHKVCVFFIVLILIAGTSILSAKVFENRRLWSDRVDAVLGVGNFLRKIKRQRAS